MKKTEKFSGLDLVKIFAILWICAYHFLDSRYGWSIGRAFENGGLQVLFGNSENLPILIVKYFLSFGVLGVNLFVLASGVGLSLSQNRKGESFGTFIKKRVIRILPPYYFLLFMVFLGTIFMGQQVNFFDYFTHFLGIHTFFPEFTYSISTPLWYMGVIVQLYLLFPFIFRLSKHLNWIILLFLAMILRIYLTPELTILFEGGRFFTEFLFDFTLGVLMGNLLHSKSRSLDHKIWLLFLPLGLLAMGLMTFNFLSPYLLSLFLPLTASILFIGLFSLGFYFSNPIWSKLASLVFPIYLTHYFLLTWLWPKLNFSNGWLAAGLFLVCAFFTGWLFNTIFIKLSLIKLFRKKT